MTSFIPNPNHTSNHAHQANLTYIYHDNHLITNYSIHLSWHLVKLAYNLSWYLIKLAYIDNDISLTQHTSIDASHQPNIHLSWHLLSKHKPQHSSNHAYHHIINPNMLSSYISSTNIHLASYHISHPQQQRVNIKRSHWECEDHQEHVVQPNTFMLIIKPCYQTICMYM